ncbi:hypothetical protein J2T60_002313 [Natronospira proteinivora]|uniref:Outer membrane protein beta-barrel domain-containing protein n=1 Tax=Natronospira proteinivora TaxID=1807133 RepID=A0ABT1GD67_9GAMM|nr:outer membrane beta-barrel protein [Natronospira proteinivora]MCP1728313.1 hypothetical protein [Natronospira proteinivora]
MGKTAIGPLALLTLLLAAPLQAEDDRRDFWSIHGGFAYVWDDHAFNDFDASNVASYLGGTWGFAPEPFADWLGVEAEFGLTPTDGSWQGRDWSAASASTYFSAYWGRERLYLKFRGGLAANYVDVEGVTDSDVGIAAGVGLGFKLFDQPLELHVTSIDSNINTVTLHWRF